MKYIICKTTHGVTVYIMDTPVEVKSTTVREAATEFEYESEAIEFTRKHFLDSWAIIINQHSPNKNHNRIKIVNYEHVQN